MLGFDDMKVTDYRQFTKRLEEVQAELDECVGIGPDLFEALSEPAQERLVHGLVMARNLIISTRTRDIDW